MGATYTPKQSAIRDQVHAELIRLSGLASVQALEGIPLNVQPGTRGDIAIDTRNGTLWIKTTGEPNGAPSTDGWVPVGAIGGGSTDLLLVGDNDVNVTAAGVFQASFVDANIDSVLTIGRGRGRANMVRAGRVVGFTMTQFNAGALGLTGTIRVANLGAGDTFIRSESIPIVAPSDVPTSVFFPADFTFDANTWLQLFIEDTNNIGSTAISGSLQLAYV